MQIKCNIFSHIAFKLLIMNGKNLRELREKFDLTQEELAKMLHSSRKTVNSYENGSNIPEAKIALLNSIFEKLENEAKIPEGELKPKTYGGSIKVRLVTNKAKAGWSDGFYADEYLKDMPFLMIEADENYKGNYMAFEIDGDSMEPDYIEGNIVICREVQRHLWQSKLHYKDWDFVIAHSKKGIFLKEIVNHDVEKGIITCHSINPRYEDFDLDLREVAYLYNVVEVRQKGKNKRWNRVKDFL